MDWENKTQVKKGRLGEELVDQYLLERGFVPYAPTISISHPFDRLCATKDKTKIFIAEVKTKPRRKYYSDTGINLNHFKDYVRVMRKHNIELWLFFVDEYEGKIYYADLKSLTTKRVFGGIQYPLISKGIIYFPLCAMTDVCKLDESARTQLRALSTGNYQYHRKMEQKGGGTTL